MCVTHPKLIQLLMIAASIMIRVLIASGQFMAEVPSNEQGYPASTVNCHCLNGLKLISSSVDMIGHGKRNKDVSQSVPMLYIRS